MTDGPDEHSPERRLHQSPLDEAADARIRRLLAEARHTEPMPAAFVARLEDALGDLVTERASREPRPHPSQRAPVDLAARRRRRTAANLLVAAAAVVMVGFGISQVLPDRGGSHGDATTAQDAGAGGAAAEGSSEDSSARGPEAPEPSSAPADGGDLHQTYAIRSDRFGPDVRKVRSQVQGNEADFATTPDDCVTTDVGSAEVVPATYDGAPAALVLRLPSGDVQVVDLYLCGDAVPRRSITLTAP